MKTTSEDLNKVWEQLEYAFLSTKTFAKLKKELELLGYRVEQTKGNHPKMYFKYKDKDYVVTLSSTPSDTYARKQCLRVIRRIYENY